MLVCTSCGRETDGDFAFCPRCGAKLTAAQAPREQRKTVTVLFCDVTGSTALGESTDPEALRAILARYFECMKGIVEAHGGTVEKFIGDAVMAVFGVPQVHENDALRACRAAVEMREALPELGVKARIGLNTGEVVTGTEERLATGDAVNVAARLEQVAQPGEILIGQDTLPLVRDAVETEPIPPLKLKGKAEPVPAFRLVVVHEVSERPDTSIFVGRKRELETLRQSWQQTRAERSCTLMTIVGDAGVGKSRLTAEALRSVDARVVSGRCPPYGEGITYWPVVEVVKQLNARPSDAAADAAIQSLLRETDTVTSAEEIAWAFRKLLEGQARERPLICVFDDIHWGEETFLELVEHVALLSSDAPILLLCMARPELVDRRSAWPVTIRLEPLRAADVEELIPQWIGAEQRERIARAAGGNPLFIAEMAAMGEEAGGEVAVPPTLRALLAARLEQLEPRERSVLELASVEGETFHRGAVQALASPEETHLTALLAALVRKRLIRLDKAQLPGEDGFRFRHLLLRDAAYEALPKASRAELHQRFADWLETRGSELVELDEILGYHFEQAYRYAAELGLADAALGMRAGRLLDAAGRRAFARSDMAAAQGFLSRAARLLPQDDPERIECLLSLGVALRELGEFERAAKVNDEAIERAAAAGLEGAGARGRLNAGFLRLYTDPAGMDDLVMRAKEALPLLESLEDDVGLAQALHLVALSHWNRCHVGRAEPLLERALVHAERAGDRRWRDSMLAGLGVSNVTGPTPAEDGLRGCAELLARAQGSRSTVAVLTSCSAVLEAMCKRFEAGREEAARGTSLLEDLGRHVTALGTMYFAARVELLADEPVQAEAIARTALDTLEKLGETVNSAGVAAVLAESLCRQGRFAEAEAATETSERLAWPDDLHAQVRWRATRALARTGLGDAQRGEELAREAIELLEGADDLDLRGDTLVALGKTLSGAKRQDAYAEAIALYEAKGNLASAARTRQMS